VAEEKEGKKEEPKKSESPPKPDPELRSIITHGKGSKKL
jgi:hypothetical protein